MIEVVDAGRCVRCDVCVRVCPTDVFELGPAGVPVIARQDACQTCFLCEAHCPADALYVAPLRTPTPEATPAAAAGLGAYRARLGLDPRRRLPRTVADLHDLAGTADP